jgi:hypothetical protein
MELSRRDRQAQLALSDLQRTVAALQQQASGGVDGSKTQLPGTARGRLDYSQYQQLLARIRELVRSTIPPGANVLVISKGDQELLKFDGYRAGHFPQTADGTYAGHHPADGGEAIAHLEALRGKGADYLLIPSFALWWLDHYRPFAQHLMNHFPLVARREDTALIFALCASNSTNHPGVTSRAAEHHEHLLRQVREVVRSTLPTTATVAVISKGDDELLKLHCKRAWHFPQEERGGYAGHHPADSDEAIMQLEALRAKGADFLICPNFAFWWLEHYQEFARHLRRNSSLVVRQEHVCYIFALNSTEPR